MLSPYVNLNRLTTIATKVFVPFFANLERHLGFADKWVLRGAISPEEFTSNDFLEKQIELSMDTISVIAVQLTL